MKPSLPLMLSLNAGYVDTAGFLALQGLFTAHVTGNFVTLGAALALGTTGVVSKLLALPVFCVVIAARLFGHALRAGGRPVLPILLAVKVALLALAAILALRLGPFPDGDGWRAVVTGMVMVSAMAVQNAVHRVHLASAPPSTLMTGTTTQIMLDLADLISGQPQAAASRPRLMRMAASVVGFAAGCAAAALLYVTTGVGCLAVPPFVALAALLLRRPDDGSAAR